MGDTEFRESRTTDPESRRLLVAALLGDRRANDDARRLLLVSAALAAIVGVVYGTHRADWLRVPVAYCLPVLLLYPLLLASLLFVRGRAVIPRGIFAAGVILTAGGVAFDMAATVLKTPTLEQEANPIARTLLDSDHSLGFVYAYALVAQGLFAGFIGLLWAAFLKHRLTLLLSAQSAAPKGTLAFLKAALGGGQLSWRQFLLPMRRSELPTSYHMVWLLMAVLMSAGPYRLYLGLCWLDLGRFEDANVVVVVTILLSVGAYLGWLVSESRKMRARIEGEGP